MYDKLPNLISIIAEVGPGLFEQHLPGSLSATKSDDSVVQRQFISVCNIYIKYMFYFSLYFKRFQSPFLVKQRALGSLYIPVFHSQGIFLSTRLVTLFLKPIKFFHSDPDVTVSS